MSSSSDPCGATKLTITSMSGSTVPGTFQHYIVSFTRYLTPIPEGLDMAEAAPVLCKSALFRTTEIDAAPTLHRTNNSGKFIPYIH